MGGLRAPGPIEGARLRRAHAGRPRLARPLRSPRAGRAGALRRAGAGAVRQLAGAAGVGGPDVHARADALAGDDPRPGRDQPRHRDERLRLRAVQPGGRLLLTSLRIWDFPLWDRISGPPGGLSQGRVVYGLPSSYPSFFHSRSRSTSSRYVRPEQMLKAGDIVVATSSGSRSVVGKAAMLEADWVGSFGAFCMVIRPRGGIAPRYLGYYLQTQAYREAISGLAAGIGIHNLRRAHLADLPVPIAPLAKQEAVVATIEQQLTRIEAALGALQAARARFIPYLDVSLRMVLSGSSMRSPDDERGDENGRSLRAIVLLAEARGSGSNRACKDWAYPKTPTPPASGRFPARCRPAGQSRRWKRLQIRSALSATAFLCRRMICPKESHTSGSQITRRPHSHGRSPPNFS